jgi:predicted metal-binding protein
VNLSLLQLKKLAEDIGFSQVGEVDPTALVPSPQVRAMCAADRCQMYGKSWSCPPACGSVEELGARLSRCASGILVQTTVPLHDDFDLESITQGEQLHKTRFDALARQARLLNPTCMPLAAGTCTRCKQCTYPHRPCRFPSRVFPSMEACGLLVSDVCLRSGLKYYYGPKTMTFTAAVLWEFASPLPSSEISQQRKSDNYDDPC